MRVRRPSRRRGGHLFTRVGGSACRRRRESYRSYKCSDYAGVMHTVRGKIGMGRGYIRCIQNVTRRRAGGVTRLHSRRQARRRVHRRGVASVASQFVALDSGVTRLGATGRRSTGRTAGLTRCVRSVSHLYSRLGRSVHVVSSFVDMCGGDGRSVSTVTKRAGLLSLGTSVRTTHTNRGKENFTIMTRRVHALSSSAGSLLARGSRGTRTVLPGVARDVSSVGSLMRDVGAVARGISAVTTGARRVSSRAACMRGVARRVQSRIGRL